MKKSLIMAAILCSLSIAAKAQSQAESEAIDSLEQKVTISVDTLKANADLEKYYEKNPSYDKTKDKGKAAGKAIKEAAHATKRKVVNGDENTGAGEAVKEAAKATGQTVVEATKTTGRYIKKEAPIVADSIKSKGKRLKEKVMNW